MKRRLDSLLAEASPNLQSSPKHYPWAARNSKKPRPLHALLGTPSTDTPQEQAPTPDSVRLARNNDPLTAERKFAGITLNSPVMGLTAGGQGTSLQKQGRRNELSRFSQAGALASTPEQSPSFGVCLAQPAEAEDDDDDDDDGFCIISSQSYSRMSSQVAEPCNTPSEKIKQVNLLGQDSQETQQTHFSFNATQPGAQPSQATSGMEAGTSLLPGVGTMAAAVAANTTPELNDTTTVTSVAEEGGTLTNEEESSAAKLFPIFRPKKERKMLLLIRHGESEYNKASVENRALADPNIFDPKLTSHGHKQARDLKLRLLEYTRKHGDALWLTSPLTRCIETFLDACPHLDRLGPPSAQDPSTKPLNVCVLSCIAEHVASTGDIGRPRTALMKDFPMLAGQLKQLDECWWFNSKERPNCAVSKAFGTRENKEQLKKRVESFASWLGRRPEKLVIAFGHSTFWKEFYKEPVRLRNGEIKVLRW